MKTLLRLEWLKVKNYRTFWILVALFIIAVAGINYISFAINKQVNDTTSAIGLSTGNPFAFPNVWNTVTWMSSWLLYFPGFIIIFLITNEYTFKTHRQNIIDGLSRSEFVSVKLMIAVILAFCATLIVGITSLVFGLMAGSTPTLEGLHFVALYFIVALIYILFGLFLAFFLRKAALAVGIYFIYGLIIDNIVPGILRKQFDNKPYGTYLMPIDVADGLLPFPFFSSQVKNVIEPANVYICLGLCIAWIVFYWLFTIKRFNKLDL